MSGASQDYDISPYNSIYCENCNALEMSEHRGFADILANIGTVGRWGSGVELPYGVDRRVNYTAIRGDHGFRQKSPAAPPAFELGCGGSRYRAQIEVTHPLHVLAHRRFRTIRIARRNRVRYRLMVLLQRARFKSDRIRKPAVD